MDEERLFEKLRKIEALFARATTAGERDAAGQARLRILERLRELEHEDPPVEYQFSLSDMWSRRVFLSLLRRYGLIPYRLYRQRHTTIMVRVSKRFVDETLWPEYLAFSETLQAHLNEVTERVVAEIIQADSSEASVVSEPPRLTSPAPAPPASPQPPPAPAAAAPSTVAPPNPPASEAKQGGAPGTTSTSPKPGGGKTQTPDRDKHRKKKKKKRR